MTISRRIGLGTAALVAAVLLFVAALLPPRPIALQRPPWSPVGTVIRGAFHIHTTRSDGSGTVDEVAAAAKRAGLHVVILTDHGDATRQPDPPAYRSGVLVLDAVEISTTGGHYAAIGIPASPYPLGGEPRDVVEDVARLGGVGIITHPDSAKQELRWEGDREAGDGVEWLNADSEWRDERVRSLGRLVLTYPFRGPESLAALFDRRTSLERLDKPGAGRRPIAMAGHDIHARIGLGGETDPYEGRTLVRWPTYEDAFRSFSLHLTVPNPLTGDAANDAWQVVEAIRAGHLHTVIDGWAGPAAFEFAASTGGRFYGEGDSVRVTGPVVIRVRANAPVGAPIVLYRDGVEVDRLAGPQLLYATDRAGTYRAEVWLNDPGKDANGRRPFPWVVSNSIALERPTTSASARGTTTVQAGDPLSTVDADGGWVVEKDGRSSGRVSTGVNGVSLEWALADGPKASQYSALVHPVRIPADATTLAFRGEARQPMRLSVQLRVANGSDGERWQRSIFLDKTSREVGLDLRSFTPIGLTNSPLPRLSSVTELLFVVDTTHQKPGGSGAFTLRDIAFRK